LDKELFEERAGRSTNKFQNNRLKEFLDIDKNVKPSQPKTPVEEAKVEVGGGNGKDMKSVFG
jgi:hypothetical protein